MKRHPDGTAVPVTTKMTPEVKRRRDALRARLGMTLRDFEEHLLRLGEQSEPP
jgi:hypothetical protein